MGTISPNKLYQKSIIIKIAHKWETMDRLNHRIELYTEFRKRHEYITCSFSTNVLEMQNKNTVYSIIDFG